MNNTSEQIDAIATALAKAQGELRNPAKTSENPHFRNRYADLAGGLDAIRPVLSKHGLALSQLTFIDGDMLMLDTRLIHAGSGQWLRSVYPVSRLGMKHQEGGSSMTYARRYSGFAIVGIAGADDDDDGNEAQKVDTRPTPKKVEPLRISEDESLTLMAAMELSLNLCESRDSLNAWADANKSNKARLWAEHGAVVKEKFDAKWTQYAKPRPAQAAE